MGKNQEFEWVYFSAVKDLACLTCLAVIWFLSARLTQMEMHPKLLLRTQNGKRFVIIFATIFSVVLFISLWVQFLFHVPCFLSMKNSFIFETAIAHGSSLATPLQAGGNVPKAAKEKLKLATACNDVHQWFYCSFQHTNHFTCQYQDSPSGRKSVQVYVRRGSAFSWKESSKKLRSLNGDVNIERLKKYMLYLGFESTLIFCHPWSLFEILWHNCDDTHFTGTTKYTPCFSCLREWFLTSCEALRQKLLQMNTQQDGFEHFNACFVGSFVTSSKHHRRDVKWLIWRPYW